MDYYVITYFHLFHILDNYETYEFILACILHANVPSTILLEPELAGRSAEAVMSIVRNLGHEFETNGNLSNSDQTVFHSTHL